jgi:hypothetical protein
MQDAAAGAMQPQVQVGGAAARAAAPATQDAAATQLLADASAPTLADAAAGDDAEDTTVAAADTAAAAGVNAALATSAVEQQQQGQLQLLKPQMQGLDGVGPAPTQAAAAAVEAAPPAAGINGSSSSHHQEAGPSEADALPALEAKLPSFAQRQQATQQQQQQPSLLPELQPQQALQAVQGLPGPPQEQLQIAQQQLGVAAVGAPAPEAAPRVPDAAAAASAAAVLPLPDPVRQFVFTLDLRSFQAGRRLPVTLGSIYVTAWMPQELTSEARWRASFVVLCGRLVLCLRLCGRLTVKACLPLHRHCAAGPKAVVLSAVISWRFPSQGVLSSVQHSQLLLQSMHRTLLCVHS